MHILCCVPIQALYSAYICIYVCIKLCINSFALSLYIYYIRNLPFLLYVIKLDWYILTMCTTYVATMHLLPVCKIDLRLNLLTTF